MSAQRDMTTALPSGWRCVRLRDVISEAQSGFATSERLGGGIIQLRMNNVTTRGAFDWSSFIRVPAESNTLQRYSLRPGDVLFNNTNSTELVGKSALFVGYDEPIVFSNHFTRLRTDATALEPAFLARWLQQQWTQGLFAAICNRWVGQSAVQRDKLLALEIPLPPLDEQRYIAETLATQMTTVARMEMAATAQLRGIEALPGTLLREACSGALSARRPPAPTPETMQGKRERMAAIIAVLLEECRERGRALGRTVASKSLYLAAAHAGVPLGVPFRRWQYGPYYSGIREVETYAEGRRWFSNHSRQWGVEYIPGDAFTNALAFAPSFLHGRAGAMREIAALLAGLDTDGAEAVGTLYAAWNDFLLDDVQPDDATIIREVRENWHAEKAKIPVAAWEHWLAWMRAHDLTPRGTEPRTVPWMEGQHG